MEYVLKTHNLTKEYKHNTAVKDVNINIRKGEIYGFLGKNGAGKTTAIRMIMGLIKPSSGSIEMFEKNMKGDYQRPFERIGSIIETPGAYPNLTGEENLDIHRRYMGVQEKSSVDEALELVGLLEVKKRKVKNYSLGMKQRLGLARALLHHPSLLILDEPTNGLDPRGIKEIRQLILDLAETRQITVLISSHILSEIEHLATTVGIIHQGKLLKELSLEEINQKNRHYIEIDVSDAQKASMLLEQKLYIEQYQVMDQDIIRIYERTNESEMISQVLIENQVGIKKINVSTDTLEDYFIHLTEGDAE
ncbi:ABC transporter ATP-binding protein [Virgibacillus sp. NKC19-3]|uniref:ABC transporter ATP-binding protein n=1 Tax=Virgibacillus saliphilus TaxID=2831674 RepID=UPI001C9B2E85|nr:ABC transporter ATP-binding protein [Virgibacillus sp. NKC19-3]MBY7142547.1 ABC transporter ATP-binding protein [Virgibacillus sp. NKC19-3]